MLLLISSLCIDVKGVRKKKKKTDPGIDRMKCQSDYMQAMITNETGDLNMICLISF